MRRALAVLASIGLAAGTIALAIPSHAATTVTVTVTDGGNSGTFALSPSAVTATNVTIDNQTTIGAIRVTTPSATLARNGNPCVSGCDIAQGTSETFAVLSQASNDQVQIRDVATLNRLALLLVTYTAGGGGGGNDDSGASGSAGSAPAPVMQQFGLPVSGNCEDGYSDSMNWSGVGYGGWGISWAQWVNDGTGGPVCTRTVMYDTSTAKWTVN